MMKTVLLLSRPHDAHIVPVFEEIRHRGGSALMCDVADFPEMILLTAQLSPSWTGTLSYQGQSIALERLQSIWWRRPRRYHCTSEYPPAVCKLLDQEAYYGFVGLLLGAPDEHEPIWVSRPDRIRAAEFKPSQLAVAQKLGLRVPKTLITNDPVAVAQFYEVCHGQMICKPVWKGTLDLDDEAAPGQSRFIYTNEVLPEHLTNLAGIQATAHCFQECIQKKLEIRVVIIGQQIFSIAIHSQQAERTRLDWRRSYIDLQYSIYALPQDLAQTLFQLVRTFGLQYASMDLILTPEGEYVWLEANPNGQFYWLEPPTGLPMAQAMANLLLSPEEYALW